MKRIMSAVGVAVLGAAALQAQGRGGSEWTTSSYDAQRTGWVKTDPRISVQTMTRAGEFGTFKFLWKLKLEFDPKAATTLTQPVLIDRIIGFRGFKSIAYVATQSETVHAIDYDFGTTLWKYHVNYTASPPPVTIGTSECPAGLSATLSRPTAIAPSTIGGRGGGGRGGRSGGGVGEAGRGAVTLSAAGAGSARGAGGAGGAGAPGAGGAGARGAAGAVPGSAAAAAGNQPGGLPGGARQGGPGGGGGRGGPFRPGDDAAYVVGSDGYLHALNIQNGWDNMTPALFVPSNTHVAGLIVATSDEGAVAYAATTNKCGSQPDAVWAMDLGKPEKPVTAFKVGDATIAGSAGPAIGRDGTVYVVTGAGNAAESNSVFALEPKTLKQKGVARVAGGNFTSSPVVISWQDKDALLVAGAGKLYILDPANLSAGPIATSAGGAEVTNGALTTWTDAANLRWVALSTANGIATFKLADQGGKPAFQPGWTSVAIASPLVPLVVNGVLFTASSGTRAAPGVVYGFDAATGKPLWTSGRAVTTTIKGSLSAGGGTLFVPGADSTLYAFGFEIEK